MSNKQNLIYFLYITHLFYHNPNRGFGLMVYYVVYSIYFLTSLLRLLLNKNRLSAPGQIRTDIRNDYRQEVLSFRPLDLSGCERTQPIQNKKSEQTRVELAPGHQRPNATTTPLLKKPHMVIKSVERCVSTRLAFYRIKPNHPPTGTDAVSKCSPHQGFL